MKKLKIKDILVIALVKEDGKNPIGEACKAQAYSEMTLDDRGKMMVRLLNKITILINEANETHLVNGNNSDTEDINLEFITRLSTNEFFFYTFAPLTLKEFETLMNNIAEKGAKLTSGIQLVLGSFAVKTATNQVMNVTPHITLGQPVSFTFLIKNYTSPIDVRFKERNSKGYIETLKVFDRDKGTTSDIPKIDIQGIPHLFTFNNVIACKTPGGESFLTAVDICLDHFCGVAKNNVKKALKKEPTLLKQVISQLILSNTIKLEPRNCFHSVIHVDPVYSLGRYKPYPTQIMRKMRSVSSWLASDNIEIFRADHLVCQTVEEKIELDVLEKLSIGIDDKLMNEFIIEKKRAFAATHTREEGQAILSDIKKISRDLKENEAIKEIITIIANFRKAAGFFTIGMNQKADRIESALKGVSIEDRCHLLQSDSFKKDIVEALASHRHIGRLTKNFTGTTSKTYKNFKLKFFSEETTEPVSSEKTELDSPLKKL